jgi:hypothetical protein
VPFCDGEYDVANRSVGHGDALGSPARRGHVIGESVDGFYDDLRDEPLLLAGLAREPLLSGQWDVHADAHGRRPCRLREVLRVAATLLPGSLPTPGPVRPGRLVTVICGRWFERRIGRRWIPVA